MLAKKGRGGGERKGGGRGGGGGSQPLTCADARSGAGTGEGSRLLRDEKRGRRLQLLPLLVFKVSQTGERGEAGRRRTRFSFLLLLPPRPVRLPPDAIAATTTHAAPSVIVPPVCAWCENAGNTAWIGAVVLLQSASRYLH